MVLVMPFKRSNKPWIIRRIPGSMVRSIARNEFSGSNFVSVADLLGSGSTQATTLSADDGKDQAFWDALNTHVQNLHAVISGHGMQLNLYGFASLILSHISPDHGNEWCAREPTKNVIFCFDKHSG